MIQIEKTKKEDDTMLPPRKRGRLRSISSRTRSSSSSKSQTTKTKSSAGELKATKASRSLLKVIDECFKTSPQQMDKSTSESGFQRRNRIISDQVSPS